MIARGALKGFWGALSGVLFLALVTFYSAAFASTTITSPENCVRVVTLKIEIFSDTDPYVWTDSQLDAMDADTREWAEELMSSHTSYGPAGLNHIAAEWQAEIESVFNGPTKEQVEQAAEELGVSPEDMENAVDGGDDALRDRLDRKAREMMDNAGQSGDKCAEVNCCKIYFKVDVKVRADDDEPTEGYNQVEVMTRGYRSNVTTADGGLHNNQNGTTGRWGYDPNNAWDASAAHESGHLMGLDDKYHEDGGHEEGHDHDLMKGSYGWPHNDGLEEILEAGGAPCDCCPRDNITDGQATDINMGLVFAGDALAGGNCDHLRTALSALEGRLRNLQLTNIPITEKMALSTRLQERINQLRRALEDCPRPEEDETALAIPEVPFTFDSNICEYYGGGTIDLPFTPYGPFIPFGPETPGTTPPTQPGTTPPTEPGTTPPTGPGTTPPGEPTVPIGPFTPVTPGGTLNPDLVNPLPIDTVIERHPGIEHGAGVPEGGTFIEIVELSLTSTEPIIVTIPEDDDDDETTPPPPVFIVKAEQAVIEGDQTRTEPVEGAVLKLGFPPPELPNTGTIRTAEATDDQHDEEPRHVVTDEDGIGVIFADGFESGDVSAWSGSTPRPSQNAPSVSGARIDMTPTKSSIVYLQAPEAAGTPTPVGAGEPTGEGTPTPAGGAPDEEGTPTPAGGGQNDLPESVKPYVTDSLRIGDTWALTLSYKYSDEEFIIGELEDYEVEENHYRDKQTDDPYHKSKGSWGQSYDDQWAIKRVGFGDGRRGARHAAGDDLAPVVVAVIDTGLDWNHADISWDNIWQNEDETPDNGIDDDMNGYIDDVIGWDFYANSNQPWDQDGHGTFITGMIAATTDNGVGIAGLNPAARIMVLKALNDFGHTRASFLAKAIKYAADNGAQVINLSVGGRHLTKLERLAVEYAHAKGVVIVVAAGNEGTQVSDYGLTPYEEVIAVGSTDLDDKRAIFSNWGAEVDVAAPGVDVLSLRARRTDFMRHIRNVQYEAGSAYVGEDKRYYRSSGTSFSTPIVSGIASLILSANPKLTNVEVKRMILNSAEDIETPGHDQYTGYGLVDAVAALQADPAFEIIADIATVEALQDAAGNYFVSVTGTAAANDFDYAEVSIGAGETPESFKTVGERINRPVFGAGLAHIPADEFRAAPVWIIRVVVTHKNGKTREERFTLTLG